MLPLGGSITLGKLLPIIFFTYFYGLKSGIFAGIVYSFLQIIIFFHIPPAKTAFSFLAVILLDYTLPYVFIGLTHIFKNYFSSIKKYFTASILFSYGIRFISSATSGVLVWGAYVPNKCNVWIYSICYNLIYIIPEMLISLVVCNILLNFFTLKNANHTF